MRLEHRPWTFTCFTIARVLIQVPLAVVFLVVFHWGPAGYLGANLVTAILLNLAALPIYVPQAPLPLGRQLMRSMLAFAIPAMFTAISFFFLKLSDRFFLLHYQGKAEVGLYTVANSLSQPLYIVGMAFRMAWPQWHYAKLNEPEEHKRMVSRSSTYFMAFNAILLVLVGIYLPLVIHVLLDEELLVDRADDVRADPLRGALQPVLHLLDRLQRRQEEPPDPGDHAGRLGRQHRAQLPARPEVRHVRGGLDDGDRLRHPRRARLLHLATATTRSPTSGGG